jgi:hypothetical protein
MTGEGPGPARYGGTGRAQIIAAVPGGSRRLRSRWVERNYLDALTTWPELAELYPVARANILEVAKWLARHASWEDGTTRPTRDAICRLAGICATTWKKARRRLEAWGFLGTVEHGTTPEFAPMALARDGPNTAAVYVLCVPRKHRPPQVRSESRPPTPSSLLEGFRAPRARPENPGKPDGPASGRTHPRSAAAPCGAAPADAMAGVMRKAAGQTITDGWCGWLAAPFLAAGWTPRDVLWAVDHPPGDHGQHRLSAHVRHPVGWLRWRLGLWLAEDGVALMSLSQVRAAAREQARAAASRLRELAGDRPAELAQVLEDTAAAVAAQRREARMLRWIQYATTAAWRARRGGRPRQGTRLQPGPAPGMVWAMLTDEPVDRLFVVVHHDPDAPERNYSIDTEQR